MLKLLPYFFRGGIHPPAHKRDTANICIRTSLPLAEHYFLPLSLQGGAATRPLVKVGERVRKGQRIAESAGSMAAHQHAPTSGTVVDIAPHVAPHPSGRPTPTLILARDGEDRWVEDRPPGDPFARDPDQLASEIEAAGIVGMGGAVFPAAVKLRQGRRFEIKTLLVNGGECEPYLTTDDRLMRERAAEIVDGARLAQYIIESYRVVIAVENNKPQAIAALRKAAAPFGSIEVLAVPSRYPMGSAKQMIQAITGLEVPAGARSNDLGVLVHNVGTIYAIQQALRHGRPLISRVATIGGDCVVAPRNVEALIGTPVSHLLRLCGGLRETPAQLVMGGPMMGRVLPSTAVPLLKGSGGILALSQAEVNAREETACIRCGRCAAACPMGLLPMDMARLTAQGKLDDADALGLRDCLLCGSCAYVCPSHIPLVHHFEHARGQQSLRRASQRKLELGKRLATARQVRLEREAAARQAAKGRKQRGKAAEERPVS